MRQTNLILSSEQRLSKPNRRRFIAGVAAAAAVAVTSPRLFAIHPRRKDIVVGSGEHQYRVDHQCVQLPGQYSWQTTHNVAVDAENNLYVIHEGRADQPNHPSIFVFDSQGKFMRAFGQAFQGGGHGIEVRQEGSEQFLYVAAYQQVKSFCKLTLDGEILWERRAPLECKVYHPDEATNPKQEWGRNRFMPTNFAFLPGGDFYLADGYGSFFIHRYDRDGKYLNSFGGPGKGEGKFNTPHGIWIDDRNPDDARVVICDRANNQLQIFSIEGVYEKSITGFGLPANADRRGDLLLVPELMARVSLLDKNYQPVVTLGEDVERIKADSEFAIRSDQSKWVDGKFIHPHDACFDREGNIYVADWVRDGRVTKLTKI